MVTHSCTIQSFSWSTMMLIVVFFFSCSLLQLYIELFILAGTNKPYLIVSLSTTCSITVDISITVGTVLFLLITEFYKDKTSKYWSKQRQMKYKWMDQRVNSEWLPWCDDWYTLSRSVYNTIRRSNSLSPF